MPSGFLNTGGKQKEACGFELEDVVFKGLEVVLCVIMALDQGRRVFRT